MSGINAFPDPPPYIDELRVRINELAVALEGRGHTVKVDDHEAFLTIVHPNLPTIAVWCIHRRADDGQEWFFLGDGTPLCEAWNITDAVVAIDEHIRASRSGLTQL